MLIGSMANFFVRITNDPTNTILPYFFLSYKKLHFVSVVVVAKLGHEFKAAY